MQEQKAFNKPVYSAYELFMRLLNDKLIEEYFHDKKFYHKSTKEEYLISKVERALDSIEPIILIKNIKDNKIKRIRLKELDDLYEILSKEDTKTTSE